MISMRKYSFSLLISFSCLVFVGVSCSSSEEENASAETSEAKGESVDEMLDSAATDKSSAKKAKAEDDGMGLEGEVASTGEGEEAQSVDIGGEGEEAPGILGFVAPEKGVSVTTIKWGQPIGQDNPGADCELRSSKKKGFYTCVVKEGKYTTILTIIEKGKGDARTLAKMTLDSKGVPTWKRWVKELQQNGYKFKGKGKKVTWSPRMTFISSDGKSRADVIYVGSKKAVTVILKPAKG